MKTIPGLGLQGQDNALQEAADLGFKHFLLLEPEGIQGGDIGRVLSLVPDALFNIRFYSPNRMSQHPAVVAVNDYARLIRNTTAEEREHIASAQFDNEPNRDHEHQGSGEADGYWKSPEGYRRINEWRVAWIEAWQNEAENHGWKPDIVCGPLSPGNNSPGHQPESEYEWLQESMAASDILAFNVYGPIEEEWAGSGRLVKIVAKIELLGLGHKRRIVTEVNKVNFAEFCRYASGLGIERAYWFLWRSDGDDHRILDFYNPEANPKIGDRWILGLAEYMAEEENGGSLPMPPITLDQLAHKIWDDGCRIQGKPWVEGYNPNAAIHEYREVRPHLGMMLTGEYSMEGFRIVVCSMGLIIYDPATGRTDAANCAAALKMVLARWGYPPKG